MNEILDYATKINVNEVNQLRDVVSNLNQKIERLQDKIQYLGEKVNDLDMQMYSIKLTS